MSIGKTRDGNAGYSDLSTRQNDEGDSQAETVFGFAESRWYRLQLMIVSKPCAILCLGFSWLSLLDTFTDYLYQHCQAKISK